MPRSPLRFCPPALLLTSLLMAAGCGGGGTSTGGNPDGGVVTDASIDGGATDGDMAQPDASADGGAGVDAGGPGCGDGVRQSTEACDDRNTRGGDGCAADCAQIEPGFICPAPGFACVKVVCGDKRIQGDEQCDDGNARSGDGCSSECRLEDGWACPLTGAACVAARCGDGRIAGAEQCDDGDTQSGDGCSSECRLEDGYKCGAPGTPCTATVCGDGVVEGTEQCDDGNVAPYDGCDPSCRLEPSCAGGECVTSCGDGVVIEGSSEQCDDGNQRDGDGCSSTCRQEPGYVCSLQTIASPPTITLPVIFRDFRGADLSNPKGHPDFQSGSGSDITFGIAADALQDVQNTDTGRMERDRPVFSGKVATMPTNSATVTSATSFSDWYMDRSSRTDGRQNLPVYHTLSLARVSSDPTSPDYDSYEFATDRFFPIDGEGFTAPGASPSEPLRDANVPGKHNFSFTTEVHYWFQYQGDEVLNFTGDDDLWVFVDGHLCLDVGGLHPAVAATLDFADPSNAESQKQRAIVTACKARLTPGKTYEVAIFHAERHTTASNFRLTLRNFFRQRSTCDSICGDGIVTAAEACDDGENLGGYNGCMPGCQQLGPYCGDGVVTAPEERCDYADPAGAGPCTPACEAGPYCGDGVRQPELGEQCDSGPRNGAPGSSCSEACLLVLG